MDRTESLRQIITFGKERQVGLEEIQKYDYDCDSTLFKLTNQIFTDVLSLYINDKVSGKDIEGWANFIECREDLDYEVFSDQIHELANPYMEGNISINRAKKLIDELNGS